MKEVFNYINTKNFKKHDICVFNKEYIEGYAKKYFIESYLPSITKLTSLNDKKKTV